MAVAASNRRTQLQQPSTVMISEPIVLTDCHAKTHLLSGGNTLLMLPQVRLTCCLSGGNTLLMLPQVDHVCSIVITMRVRLQI